MKRLIMFGKTLITFAFSLTATSGVALLLSLACQRDDQASVAGANLVTTGTSATAPAFKTVNAYPKLKFEAPIEYTHANDGTNRVFVVEQSGRIRVFDNNANAASAGIYLDIRNKVAYGGEMGLLGLAFHPKFKENGFFYVNYTKDNPRETIVSRFKASSADASTVEPGSEVILFRFNQPYSNHNGGKLQFGPDGYLYVSTGDGGSGGDPQNHGQNKQSWLGKILRVDVNSTEKGNYGVPKDNPFVGEAGHREEIFAYGLRNPWRFSFDEQGRLWVADVGQNKIEEINIVTKGGNYGWRVKEAAQPFNAKDNTITDKLIDPVHEYQHGEDGNSVTGGHVYAGKANPSLQGKYIFGDFGSGRLWALTYGGGNKTTNQLLLNRAGSIAAFGEDASHELYICDYGEGQILKLAAK